jgi:hypothetical protein
MVYKVNRSPSSRRDGMVIKPSFIDVIQLNNNEVKDARISGESRTLLSHYTNIDTLRIILRDKTFLLNRIDKVNDLVEKDYLGIKENYLRVYVGCFTHDFNESIPQWYMYTPKEEGVRISLNLKDRLGRNCLGIINEYDEIKVAFNGSKSLDYVYRDNFDGNMCYCKDSSWSFELSCTDIIYSSTLMKDNPICITSKNGDMTNLTPIARIKYPDWGFEFETRILGMFRTTKSNIEFEVPEYILVPLDLNKFDVTIILNPWSTDMFRNQVEEICEEFLQEYNYRIEKSKFYRFLRDRDW